MKKRIIGIILCICMILSVMQITEIEVFATSGGETKSNPYIVTTAAELSKVLGTFGTEEVCVQLGGDISNDDDSFGPVFVRGIKELDLNGHTINIKFDFFTSKADYSLFIVASGASFTIDDSAGGGKIIFDRRIPAMGECSVTAPIILDRPLNVFNVNGTLTVNGGEITAGHYESEYYTYTHDNRYSDSQTNAGTVNSIAPGNAVVVNAGGCFFSNGGEYYGRGFTVDDNYEKAYACSAVVLNAKASAVISAGDFYGKSNANVFSVSDEASIRVYTGNFYARYDNRVTLDKWNGVAYYVNVDCGQIGIPLRAFCNDKSDFTHIYVNSEEYNFKTNFSMSDNAEFVAIGIDGNGADVTVENIAGNGTYNAPYLVKYASDFMILMERSGTDKVYLRLENDLVCKTYMIVAGNIVLDLNGHTVKEKMPHDANRPTYSMFTIDEGASITLEDSVGDGEIIFDRGIPAKDEFFAEMDIILEKPLTVFEVNGSLTVNGGEITAGHYESEYYTYTQEWKYSDDETNAGSVNSVVPGYAVVVNNGARFVSNGGKYYGRGFTIDDNGEKETTCAAVKLNGGAVGVINDGEFYGKSNADVFSVHWGASAYIYSGTFKAEYDNRITVDKYDIIRYVNVDCGKIGIPLRAFNHKMSSRMTIWVDSDVYTFSSDYTAQQSNDFENLGSDGTGITVTVRANDEGTSQITKQDGTTDTFEYSTSEHYTLVQSDAPYFNEAFETVSSKIHIINYYWKVEQYSGGRWHEVEYEDDAPVRNGYYYTTGTQIDLYNLAEYLKDGMNPGELYRVKAHSAESWRSNNEYLIYTESSGYIRFTCAYEEIGTISLTDSVTGIVWPKDGDHAKHTAVETDKYNAALAFEEFLADGTWDVMSELDTGTPFEIGGTYRLKVVITPKDGYCVSDKYRVFVGGKTVSDKEIKDNVLTGYLPIEVLPNTIDTVIINGTLTKGCRYSSATPLCTGTANATVSVTWMKDGKATPSGVATYGKYYARIKVTARTPYIFTNNTTVNVMGKEYKFSVLASDKSWGYFVTDVIEIACDHSGNINSYTNVDEENHRLLCSVCGEEIDCATHVFGNWVTNGNVNTRTCRTCGYEETVNNGKIYIGKVKLDCNPVLVGSSLPEVFPCEAQEDFIEIDGDVEWFKNEVDWTAAVSSDTIVEAGAVYYAQVKLLTDTSYYVDNDTTFETVNPTASATIEKAADQNFAEVILKFIPRTDAIASFTLGEIETGNTYRQFLSQFSVSQDGADSPFWISIYKNGVCEGELAYSPSTEVWSMYTYDVDTFLARTVEADTNYKVSMLLMDSGKYFSLDNISALKSDSVESVITVGGDMGCSITAIYAETKPGIFEEVETEDNVTVSAETERKIRRFADLEKGSITANTNYKFAITEKVPEDTEKLIALENKVGTDRTVTYYDAAFTKTVDTGTENITDTGDTVLSFTVAYDMTDRCNLAVYRYHDGEAEALTRVFTTDNPRDGTFYVSGEKENTQITVFASKFSPYAFASGELPDVLIDTVYYASLTLNDNINVNFFMKNLGDDFILDKLTVTVDGEPVEVSLTGGDVTGTLAQITPKNMDHVLHIVVTYDGVEVKNFTYSIRSYCEAVFASAEYGVDSPLGQLCKAVLNYGKWAADYFNEKNETGTSASTVNSDYVIDFTGVTVATTPATGFVSSDIVSKAAAMLTLDSQISLTFMLKTTETLTKDNITIRNNADEIVNPANIVITELEGTYNYQIKRLR